ncbi:MAG: MurR/RpiR family transcriptional regulator [Clostridia bacterium]|nr:MurR/RpiR family transcriptional regulator [Clostridia bacterium]
MSNDLLSRINFAYKTLSKGQRKLADYIMANYDRAAFITAAKMGTTVGVSESTVVRFSYALGYDGYPELQRALQDMIRNKLTAVQRIKLNTDMDEDDVLKSVLKADMQNIRSTIENIDNQAFKDAIEALEKAEHIYVIGLRSAAPLAQLLSYYLNFILDNVVSVSTRMNDIYESMLRIGENDVCIGISFPRYSARTVEALKFAKGHNAKIIALTDALHSPIAALADYPLIAKSDMVSFADSFVAPLSLINALIVALSLRNEDKVCEHFNMLESVWGTQKVYMAENNQVSHNGKQ